MATKSISLTVPAYDEIPIPKADQPRYPILGTAVFNLTRGDRVR